MAFLQYISSYSGLKEIQLVPENFPHWIRRGGTVGLQRRGFMRSVCSIMWSLLKNSTFSRFVKAGGVWLMETLPFYVKGEDSNSNLVKPLIDTVAQMLSLEELKIVGVSDGAHNPP